MTKSEYKEFNRKAEAGEIKDELNPAFTYVGVKSKLLVDIVNGKINPVEIAKRELEARGLNYKGEFVGFKN